MTGPTFARGRFFRVLLWDLAIGLALLHGLAIWVSLGGRGGIEGDWPIWRDDHPLYYHSALVTRTFLRETWTTAGYDPAFMAGYAKSIVFPSSSTLPELVVFFFGGDRPAFAYKAYVLATASALPWLLLATAWAMGVGPGGACLAVGAGLTYFWTDFAVNYAAFGMLPYLVGVPLGLLATALVSGYLGRGGIIRWSLATAASSACLLVHFTTAMLVVPAALACYAVAWGRGGLTRSRHLGVWLLPAVVLALNAFWWLPGIYLASTKGPSDFAFSHPEPVAWRLIQIITTETPIEAVLIALGLVGIVATLGRDRIGGVGLLAFAGFGFFWGYLAGGFRTLDFLQPGRHTYAFYLAMSVAAGLGWSGVCRRLGEGGSRLPAWATLGLIVAWFRVFSVPLDVSISTRLGRGETLLRQFEPKFRRSIPFEKRPEPFLSSRPSSRLLWVVDRVGKHVARGERLLYEEGGFGLPAEPDPFEGGRFSGLLPERCGVEVIGGPYLHASLQANFTQFGEGKLFGDDDWGRDRFVAFAKLYRPAAILCWSRRSRAFCKNNPDLIEVLDEEFPLLIGRVKGFPGATIRGEATVEARPNRLIVRDVRPGLDGLAVLRYHATPCLRSVPEGLWEPVMVDGDPVPFIGVRASERPIELELRVPPRRP